MRILLILLLIAPGLMAQRNTEQTESKTAPAETAEKQETARAIEFPDSLNWLNASHQLSLDDFQGKFLLLSFWTSSSALSIAQLKTLKDLNEQHSNLEVVIVHSGKYEAERKTENIRQAVIEHDIPFPVINDSAFTLWRDYGVSVWPTNILINPTRDIVMQSEGVEIVGDISANIQLYEGATKAGGSPSGSELSKYEQGLLVMPSFVESDGSFSLFISESRGHRIVQTDFNQTFERAIGTGKEGWKDGDMRNAHFSFPHGTAFDPIDSVLYIADTGNDVIRKCDLKSGMVSTVLGNGSRSTEIPEMVVESSHSLNQPIGLELMGNDLYIAMTGWNQIWKYDTESGMAVPVAGSGEFGFEDGKDLDSKLAEPYDITRDPDGVLYFTERQSSAVRTFKKGKVNTLVGAGVFESGDETGRSSKALLQGPSGIEYFEEMLYVSDQYNHKIKTVDPFNGRVETFLGSGEQGYRNGVENRVQFNHPSGLTVLRDQLFIADKYNQVIRQYDFAHNHISSYDFSNKDQMQFHPVNPYQVYETDTILIPKGESTLTLFFELDSLWELTSDALQSAIVATREPGIIEDVNGINPETQGISFELENHGARKHFVAEVNLIYQHSEQEDLKYYRSFSLMVNMRTDEEAPSNQEASFQVPFH